MKTILVLVSILIGESLFALTTNNEDLKNSLLKKLNKESTRKAETKPIHFIENKGQMHDQNFKSRPDVLFGALAGNMSFHLKKNGVSYQLNRVDSYKDVVDFRTKKIEKEIDRQAIYRIDLTWINANTNFVTTTDKTVEGYDNYYTEGCPKGGVLDVKSYTGVSLLNLYKGINLHFYEKDGHLKHDYIVAAGANYKQIRLKVEGARVIINQDGSLLLNTPLGIIQEGAPLVFQNGKQLKAKWVIKKNVDGSQTISFDINNYNPKQELIIDPITRAWGTYYGDGGCIGRSSTIDALGNVYLGGRATSNGGTIIATVGAHQTTFGGGPGIYDAFLVKFNSGGVREWGTYYGGNGRDDGYSCSIDATGNVYLSGTTSSTSPIATAGAHQTLYGGGVNDAFLVKFNSSGVRIWGTYYGGLGEDSGVSCATDVNGNVYMTGYSAYSVVPAIATDEAQQFFHGGGFSDGFLVKFNSSGVRQWGTYYGGPSEDYINSCATDGLGNIFLAGKTTSSSSIASVGAHQSTFGGGLNEDAFLVKFNSNGIRQWGTYYGDDEEDQGSSCATDNSGNVYLTGHTRLATLSESSVISTSGSHQTFNAGNFDAFLVKFNSNGIRQWGTFYGGNNADLGLSCTTNAIGEVYMAGYTKSNINMATADAYQITNGGGAYDAFLIKFSSNGIRRWGTYYGSAGDEYGNSCTTKAGNVYLAGQAISSSSTIITSTGAHQTLGGGAGNLNAFLVKFEDCSGPTTATVNQTACNTYTWPLNGATYSASGTYTYEGSNDVGCPLITTLNLTINSVNVSVVVSDPMITANASGASYQWIDCNDGNAIIPGATFQSFTPTANGNYAVIVTTANCTNTSVCQTISSLGIEEISTLNMVVYPNPTNDFLNIVGESSFDKVLILNNLGQKIKEVNSNLNHIKIDLSSYAVGVYYVRVFKDNASQIYKIVRQ